jgi:hypothetical protein
MADIAQMPSSRDAVIVVPGVMGSELKDSATGKTLWGISDARWYLRAWTSGTSLADLRLTEAEQAGKYGRVEATRVLRFPAFAPILQGFEPYTRLLDGLRRVSVHTDAVGEFAYDWRLPVAYNATLLAEAIHRHLKAWRNHPTQLAAQRADPEGKPPQLVIVAHSMGGLLARHLSLIPGAVEGVKSTITLGTPFYGSIKAAIVLSSGHGGPVPLPRARFRDLAARLPGVYELLPTYRCVDVGSTARQLSPDDVADFGGDRELARASRRWHIQVADVAPPGHVQVVGAHQPTGQSLTVAHGVATAHRYTCRPVRRGTKDEIERVDLAGDGTVARESAQLPSTVAMPLAQSHGALAKTSEAILIVNDVLANRSTGPWLGAGEIGVEVPDIVTVNKPFDIVVTGVEHPRDASSRLADVTTGRQIQAPALVRADGQLLTRLSVDTPGIYRVEVAGGGASAVTQFVLVSEPAGHQGKRTA